MGLGTGHKIWGRCRAHWIGFCADCPRDIRSVGLPEMRTLELNLEGNRVGDNGAHALAALKDANALQALYLNLSGNGVGDSGAHAISGLSGSRTLRTLCLNLQYNTISDTGAQAIAALKAMPALRTLALDISRNNIGFGGAEALTALRDATALRALDLDLAYNCVGDRGAQALAALKGCTHCGMFVAMPVSGQRSRGSAAIPPPLSMQRSGVSSAGGEDEELFSTVASATRLVKDLSSNSEGFGTDVRDTRRKRRRAGVRGRSEGHLDLTHEPDYSWGRRRRLAGHVLQLLPRLRRVGTC